MKTIRLAILLVVALAQIAVPASIIWKRQLTLHNGRVWKFRTAPVDPIDSFRGRYVLLNFEAETFARPEAANPTQGDSVFLTLRNDENGFAVADDVSAGLHSGDDVVRADYLGYYDGKMRVRFPFDEFWVSEVDASAVEAAYNANSRRENLNAYAVVRVRNGDAAIEELYLDGKPLHEYLHPRAPH